MISSFFIFLACSIHHNTKGLIFQEEGKLQLGTVEGRTYILHAGDDTAYLDHLGGCGATVSGTRFARHIWLKKWHITDAGDGSEPFIGTIAIQGVRIILRDMNTGQELEIIEGEELLSLDGAPILITGIIVGAHQIQLIEYRVLE